jgi:hypothetical protein
MKTQFSGITRLLAIICLAVGISGLPYVSASAQEMAFLPAKNDSKSVSSPEIAAATMAVAVYRVEKTMRFKIHLENYVESTVRISIHTPSGKRLYQEIIPQADKYIRSFNMNALPDGEYALEISNGKEIFRRTIHLQTDRKKNQKGKPSVVTPEEPPVL